MLIRETENCYMSPVECEYLWRNYLSVLGIRDENSLTLEVIFAMYRCYRCTFWYVC